MTGRQASPYRPGWASIVVLVIFAMATGSAVALHTWLAVAAFFGLTAWAATVIVRALR